MSTVYKKDGLKLKVNERDHNPPHVHVVGYGSEVRINLRTLEPMDDSDYSRATMRKIIELVKENLDDLWEAWNEHHE